MAITFQPKKGGGEMKKKTGLLFLSLLGVALICLLLASPVGAKSTKVYKARLATSWPTTHPSGQACHAFAAGVKKATKGRLQITVYDSGTLYGSKNWLEAVSSGSVEFGGSFSSTAERYFPDMGSIVVPYAFGGYQEIIDFFKEDEVGKEVMTGFENQMNVQSMLIVANGHFQLYTTKDIKSLDDLKGMKARTFGPALAKLLSAMGMSPVTMPSEEVYQALQSGMVKAYISNIIGPRKFSYTDFSKVMIQPPWGVLVGLVLANKTYWGKLPEDIRASALEAANKVSRDTMAKLDEKEADVLKEFQEKLGGRIHNLTAKEVEYMKQLTKDKVGPGMASTWKNKKLWPRIQKLMAQ